MRLAGHEARIRFVSPVDAANAGHREIHRIEGDTVSIETPGRREVASPISLGQLVLTDKLSTHRAAQHRGRR